ncbi:hypothetical protein CALVIDRAFT_411003 [Calocera viscosa TUFC12733]|uniref:Uncharacterized protein n=1 Tax=Calocera viscosa (strain TUFC12733) TaxID=1330018 RepID=A0A167G7B1_CALVF|nr:hypothetical protein CALVIDRAFT_411003 [Calocera viscosa TUFC12733]
MSIDGFAMNGWFVIVSVVQVATVLETMGARERRAAFKLAARTTRINLGSGIIDTLLPVWRRSTRPVSRHSPRGLQRVPGQHPPRDRLNFSTSFRGLVRGEVLVSQLIPCLRYLSAAQRVQRGEDTQISGEISI